MSGDVKALAERIDTIYELFVQTIYNFVRADGTQLMNHVVDACLAQIEFYREQVLASDDLPSLELENKAQLYDVKILLRLLQDCAGDHDSK